MSTAVSLTTELRNREFAVVAALSHPNIVRILEWMETKKDYAFVMEALDGEPLSVSIAHTVYTETQVRDILRQVISAINYCHQKRVLHRDLSLDTIWITGSTPKIALFGTLSFFDAAKNATGRGGSAYYVAPELIEGVYDERCDLWSCGVILHILLTGFPPFEGRTELDTARKIKDDLLDLHSAAYSHLSHPAKDLLHRLLIKNPQYRLTASEALHHSWLQTSLPPSLSDHEKSKIATNLAAFNARSRLKDALFSFIVTHVISSKDLEEAKRMFGKMDRNGDGKLSREEVQIALLSEFGTFHDIVSLLDSDNSGYIDYNEFLRGMVNREKQTDTDTLEKAFALLDKDNSGAVTAEELRDMLVCTGVQGVTEEWQALIEQVDKNGDGQLDLKEFLELLQGSGGR